MATSQRRMKSGPGSVDALLPRGLTDGKGRLCQSVLVKSKDAGSRTAPSVIANVTTVTFGATATR